MRTWSTLNKTLDHSWIVAVERLVSRNVGKGLAAFILGERRLWADFETLAAGHLSSAHALCLAATYLYGVTIRHRGDYVEVSAS